MTTNRELAETVDGMIKQAKESSKTHLRREEDKPQYVIITEEFDRQIWEYVDRYKIPSRSAFLVMAELDTQEIGVYHGAVSRFGTATRKVSIPEPVFKKIVSGLRKPPGEVPQDPRGGQKKYVTRTEINRIMYLARRGVSVKAIAKEIGLSPEFTSRAITSEFKPPTEPKKQRAQFLKRKRFHQRHIREVLKLSYPEYLAALGDD